MSGIKTDGHNKFVSCEDCPDRCINPNCHSVCRGYIFRSQKRQKINNTRKKEGDYCGFKRTAIYNSKKRVGVE